MYNYSLIMYFLFKLYYKVINSNICSDELDDSFYFTNKLNKFKTLNIPGFKNGNDIKKKRKQAVEAIENKQGVCKMVKKMCQSLL